MKYINDTMNNPMICPFCGKRNGEVVADDGVEELYMTCNNCGKNYTVVYNEADSMYDEKKLYTDIIDVIESLEDENIEEE